MAALCPFCKTALTSLSLSRVIGNLSPHEMLPCIVYACPACEMALGTALDSREIRASIIQEIRAKECTA